MLLEGGGFLNLGKLLVMRQLRLLLGQLVVMVQIAEPTSVHDRCIVTSAIRRDK